MKLPMAFNLPPIEPKPFRPNEYVVYLGEVYTIIAIHHDIVTITSPSGMKSVNPQSLSRL